MHACMPPHRLMNATYTRMHPSCSATHVCTRHAVPHTYAPVMHCHTRIHRSCSATQIPSACSSCMACCYVRKHARTCTCVIFTHVTHRARRLGTTQHSPIGLPTALSVHVLACACICAEHPMHTTPPCACLCVSLCVCVCVCVCARATQAWHNPALPHLPPHSPTPHPNPSPAPAPAQPPQDPQSSSPPPRPPLITGAGHVVRRPIVGWWHQIRVCVRR